MHADAPRSVRRNMPQSVPVIVLGRLAVDRRWSGKRIGAGLLEDAVLRSVQVTREIAARALLGHAISDPARRFYLKFGFIESPIDPMTLMLNLSKLSPARPRPS